MVGSSVNMETAASTPSLVLLEELMDSPEGGSQLKSYPSSRTSLPNLSPVSPGGNGRSKWPQSLLQDFLRASSRRGRRRTTEVSETPDPPPVTRRIWCDSEECLLGSPFIKIQQFPQNGQCQNCGQVMKDVATNTEADQDAKPKDDSVSPQGHVTRDTGQAEPSIEEAVTRVVRRPRKNSNGNKVSFDEKSSRRRSLPMAFDWWSDKVLKRQSSNIKDNVLKSWCQDEKNPAPYGPRSVSDQAIHKTVVGASRTSVDAIKPESPKNKASSQSTLSDNGGWFKAKKELKHVSKSTPNLSYPSTQVDKLESARLAAWWEASPYPVRSQRFTFRSHASGQKVVLRKGQTSFEVSARGKRRQSTNLADLEDLMGAVSGSEEETETDGEDHTSRAILLPYEALQEEMDARAGNFNHSNSKDSIPAIRIDSTKERRTPQRPLSLFHDHLIPKTPETLSRSTPYINGSGPVSRDWSFSSPSLESVIHSQFLRNASLTSLQPQQLHHHKSFLPREGLGTPKRLQGGRRSATKGKDLLRHSWAGRPNPLSTSLLKLVKSERSSWIGAVNELPVIPEDKGKEKVKVQHGSFIRLQGSTASFHGSAVQYLGATSGLCSEEPQLDPDDDNHLRSLDTKHPHLLTGEFLVKKNIRSKPPFKRRVSPPTSYFNPWVLQPQQLRQKLESLQHEQGGNDRGNGTPKQMKPELIVVDIFDDSKEVSCSDQDCKMPQDSIMEEPINESVTNLDATEDVSRDPEGDTTLGQSGNSPPRFVRSVSNVPPNREVFVDSQSGPSGRTEKHARTTNNNRRSLSPQAREYVSRLDASGKRHSGSLAASGENEDHQMNGYRQRKKSLALAMNEGRLEMKEVCMRPLDVDLDFHLIAQLNQLNRELMDLSKSGSSTSPSSPGVGANHSFSLLENNGEILVDGEDKHNLSSSPQPPISLQVPQTRHSQGNDVHSPISSKRGKSPVEAKQKKSSHETPRRRQSDESVSPVVSSKKSSPEQKTILENSKESKSVSPREVISRIKLRFSNSKLTRGSPQRSSAGKIEIQILRPNIDNPENESGTAFKRSASLRHDSESRKTWPNLEASTEGCYEESHTSPSRQSPVYRRCESDGPVERQRKKPLLPDSNPMLEQNHNAPGSSTDSGLGKDQRHSKSSADSLLEDFHVSSQVSSSCNSNPPSRPLSSDIGDLSWEKGHEVLPPRVRRIPGYLSSSTPHSPNFLTPTTGSREDLLDGSFSRPESQEDLLGSRGNGMRASGSSQGSSISHAAMQSGIKPPKPRHKPLRRSKTDLGDPSIIKAALTLAKMQGDEAPKVVEGTSKPSSVVRKRPTSALGIMGILNSSSGRESPIRQLTQSDGKPSPRLQRSQRQQTPDPLSLVVNVNAEQNYKTMSDLPLTPLTPKPRSRSLGSLGAFEIPDMTLMKRAHSLPAGLGDDELMMSDPDLSKINARMSETFEQFCAATLAEALFDHVTMDGHELTFQAGDMIEITDMTDAYWWWGCIDKQEGWLPAPFVRLKVSQGETVEECMSRLKDNTSSHQQGLSPSHQPLIRKVSLSFLSNDQVRANVIKEIITTERDYVKNLADIYEGYIEQARSRPDMFNQTLMSKLFCNIEEIYCFQQRFLADLETCIDKEMPNLSAIGDCFLKYKLTFDIYGEYCNNYPHAMNEFQTLMRDNKYVQFFEACRLLQSMIKIQLDGFLLTPVQKICKYPLQLNELLKYTRPQHPDFQPLKSAFEAMREVAQSINERKRRIEHIENIALWQKTIGDWEGDDVLDRSSMLIYSNEVNRVSLAGRHRTSPRQLFLFDHQLIICRKLWIDEWIDKTRKGEMSGKEYLTASVYMWRDILRRDLYVYKDRIDLDDCQIEDLPDGKENEWNVTLRYAWKIQNFEDQSKVYLFMCRSRKEKKRWLRHFAKERKIVHEGLTRGSSFMAAKEAALKTTSSRDKPSKPTDRGVTVRRALSMPHRKVRDPSSKEPALQLPGAPSLEVELDASTPKKKGLSLFGVQFGKK